MKYAYVDEERFPGRLHTSPDITDQPVASVSRAFLMDGVYLRGQMFFLVIRKQNNRLQLSYPPKYCCQ